MIPLLTPDRVRTIDANCIREGIDALALMEGASLGVATAMCDELRSTDRVLIACGAGNNGGDGFCIARHLRGLAPTVTVDVVTDATDEVMTLSTRHNRHRLPDDVRVRSFGDLAADDTYDVVVDALLGVGSTVALRHPVPDHLQRLNALPARRRIAVDVPTGMDALTGDVHPDVFRADVVYTIGAEKIGFHRTHLPIKVVVTPLTDGTHEIPIDTRYFRLEATDIARLLPERPRTSSKFDHGRVLVIGGTRSMPGAPSLSAHAALAVGAGLVELVAPRIHPLTPREVMPTEVNACSDGTIDPSEADRIGTLMERASVIVIGPGLGSNTDTLHMLADRLRHHVHRVPIVVDADGVRLMPMLDVRSSSIIVTPHLGELRRWQGSDCEQPGEDACAMAERIAHNEGVTLHLKVVPAVTTDGKRTALTVNGSPILGTAGSGDVLSGIIGGLLAQGVSSLDAVSLASYLHAEAGSRLRSHGRHSILAGEIIPEVTRIMAR